MKKVHCEYCGEKFAAAEPRCPSCGGRNPLAALPAAGQDAPAAVEAAERPDVSLPKEKTGTRRPRTMEELKAFAATHKLPPEHFCVGEDSSAPKVFGMFWDKDGNFVVYKNRSGGQRAVRYRGPSETAAVDELYHKMVELLAQQNRSKRSRTADASAHVRSHTSRRRRSRVSTSFSKILLKSIGLSLLIFFAITLFMQAIKSRTPRDGYYRYNNRFYYYCVNSWYEYDDGWVYVPGSELDDNFLEAYREYYRGAGVNSVGNDVPAFANARRNSSNDNRNDDDRDYNYGWDDNDDWDNDWDNWDDDNWDYDDDWDWDDDVDWDSDW